MNTKLPSNIILISPSLSYQLHVHVVRLMVSSRDTSSTKIQYFNVFHTVKHFSFKFVIEIYLEKHVEYMHVQMRILKVCARATRFMNISMRKSQNCIFGL